MRYNEINTHSHTFDIVDVLLLLLSLDRCRLNRSFGGTAFRATAAAAVNLMDADAAEDNDEDDTEVEEEDDEEANWNFGASRSSQSKNATLVFQSTPFLCSRLTTRVLKSLDDSSGRKAAPHFFSRKRAAFHRCVAVSSNELHPDKSFGVYKYSLYNTFNL